MSRVMVEASYEQDVCVLRKMNGDVHLVIQAGDIVSPGNSIGGFFARRVTFAGQMRLSLIRVTGSDKRLSSEKLEAMARGRRGFIVRPGRYLWATSSGAARNGIAHPVRTARETDPLAAIMRLAGLKLNHLEIKMVETLPAEVGDEVVPGLDWRRAFRYAADKELTREEGVITVAPETAVVAELYLGGQATPMPMRLTLQVTSPDVTRQLMADVAAKAMFGPKADAALAEAMTQGLVTAQQWVADRFRIAPSTRRGYLLVDGEEYNLLFGRWVRGPESLVRLAAQWGAAGLFAPWLDAEQRAWVSALTDARSAVQYILERETVEAGTRGNHRFLKVGNGFKVVGAPHGNNGHAPWARLLEAHPGLQEILYERAPMRQEFVELWGQSAPGVGDFWDGGIYDPITQFGWPEEELVWVVPNPAIATPLSARPEMPEPRPGSWGKVHVECRVFYQEGGDEGYISRPSVEKGAAVRIPLGGTGHYVLYIQHSWWEDQTHPKVAGAVYGLAIHRSMDGLITQTGYDPGVRYTVHGNSQLITRNTE